ncbi:MAG: hypothetical protein IJB14_02565 [Firmicutes bacterium]|nr:hypothetical protein [Bacillota bacterium]
MVLGFGGFMPCGRGSPANVSTRGQLPNRLAIHVAPGTSRDMGVCERKTREGA